MKKKIFIIIPLICILTACTSPKQEIQTTQKNVEIQEKDKENFNNIFDMFTSQVGDIRNEYNETEVLNNNDIEKITIEEENISNVDVREYTDENLGVVVNYLNVENGEAILIESEGEFLLIDTGGIQSSQKLTEYIKTKTNNLKYLIITHPSTDRLGGVSSILDNIKTEEVILPNIKVKNNSLFTNMLDKLLEKEIKVTQAIAGDNYLLGLTNFDIIAPNNENYEDIDNYSVCIKLNYINNSFLFMADAKSISEKEILDKDINISADVLKVGNYGSKYSSSASFLNKVNPKIAIINPANNPNNYPDEDTLNKLKTRNIITYRTDTNGLISIGSDGTNIYAITEIAYNTNNNSINTEKLKQEEQIPTLQPERILYPEDADTFIVYAGRDKIYHLKECEFSTNISNEMTLSIAHSIGYKPCDKCNPPQVKPEN